jgi:hypothetical protein
MDRIGVEVTRRPALYEPIFIDGWGAVDAVPPGSPGAALDRVAARSLPSSTPERPVDELRFESPLANHLPAPARMVNVRVTRPLGATSLVVLFAAFNDHGFGTRAKLAGVLADKGVATAILEAPFYGERRTHPGQVIRTVADLLTLGSVTVTEGIGLARWFAKAGWSLGFSGYSMGGSMAALAAAMMEGQMVAVAPVAAAYSPSVVYVNAVLSEAVAWHRLGPNGPQRLHDVLDSASILELPPLPHSEVAVLLAAERDGYVPLSATERLAHHWHGCDLRVVAGGHASLMRRRDLQSDVIVDSFARLATVS